MNNNPAEMSNMDLEKDMQQRNKKGNSSKDNEDEFSTISADKSKNQDKEPRAADSAYPAKETHNGSLPDPEELKLREE